MPPPSGLPGQSATPHQGWNPNVGPPVDLSRVMPGQLTGVLANLLSNALATHAFGSAGYVPGHMNPTTNLHDTMLGRQFQQAQAQAVLTASREDEAYMTRVMRGGHALTGGGAWGPQQQAAAESAARRLSAVSATMVNAGLYDTVDAMHGSRGSAAVMAAHVTGGLRYMRDPATGRAYDPARAGEFSRDLFRQLYAPGSDMNGIGAGRAGQMFDEMSRRGMMDATHDGARFDDWKQGGGTASGMRSQDVGRQASRLKEMSGAVAAMRDLFGANGRPNAPMAELFEGLNALTQGSMHWMDAGNMQMMVRRVHSMSRNMAGGLDRFVQLSAQGGALADMAGLDRSFGAQTAMGAMAFGHAFGQVAGRQGFGGLSRDEATALDHQLRIAAGASPQANRLGALMAMHEQGLIKGGPALALVQAVQSRDPKAMAQIANMDGGQLTQMLQQSGVGAATSSTFLAAQEANQEQVHRHGLSDLVRGMQKHGEVASYMRNELEAGLMGGLRDSGANQEQLSRILPAAAEAARAALMNMDGDLLSNPARVRQRNAIVADAIRRALAPQDWALVAPRADEIVATAVRQLEGSIRRDPNMRKFKNLAGLVSVNRPDVQTRADEDIRRSEAEGNVASLTSGLGQSGPLARVMDAVAGAGPDTKLTDVIARALGGTDRREVAAALSGPAEQLRATQQQYKALQDQLSSEQDPGRRKAIQAKMSELKDRSSGQVKALQDAAQAAGLRDQGGIGGENDPDFVGPRLPAGERGAAGRGAAGGPMHIRGTLRLINGGPEAEINAGPGRGGEVPT